MAVILLLCIWSGVRELGYKPTGAGQCLGRLASSQGVLHLCAWYCSRMCQQLGLQCTTSHHVGYVHPTAALPFGRSVGEALTHQIWGLCSDPKC